MELIGHSFFPLYLVVFLGVLCVSIPILLFYLSICSYLFFKPLLLCMLFFLCNLLCTAFCLYSVKVHIFPRLFLMYASFLTLTDNYLLVVRYHQQMLEVLRIVHLFISLVVFIRTVELFILSAGWIILAMCWLLV